MEAWSYATGVKLRRAHTWKELIANRGLGRQGVLDNKNCETPNPDTELRIATVRC